MVRRKISLAACALLAALGLGACTPPAGGATTAAPAVDRSLKVVATFSILGDLARNVGGDRIALTVLVGPNSDVHSYEPAPADIRALADADVILENGLGFEAWLDNLYAAADSRAERVVVTREVTPAAMTVGDEVGETDPHAWQDVAYAIGMVGLIRDALAQRDPANAAVYASNAARYLQQLQDLDAYIRQQVESLPAGRRTLVTNHDALGYFARRYGFELIGSVLGSVSTEAGEPSAAELAELSDEIKGAQVPAIFTENVENSQVIEQVAQEAGAIVAPPLFTDALGSAGSAGETYLKMMRYNVDTIVGALR